MDKLGLPHSETFVFFLPGDWGHCHRWNSGFFYAHCGWTWGNEGFGELGEFSGCNERKNDGNLFFKIRSKQIQTGKQKRYWYPFWYRYALEWYDAVWFPCRNGCVFSGGAITGAPVITDCSTPWIDRKDKHNILWKASYHYYIACLTFFPKVYCLVIHVDVWWYCLLKFLGVLGIRGKINGPQTPSPILLA